MTKPRLPDAPQTSPDSTVLTVGTDLVHIPGFSAQLEQPGTVFAQRAFTARELREARRRAQERGTTPAQHLAARWAAKESFIKAWSQAHVLCAKCRGTSTSPVILAEDVDWREIEVVTDRWGHLLRPDKYSPSKCYTDMETIKENLIIPRWMILRFRVCRLLR